MQRIRHSLRQENIEGNTSNEKEVKTDFDDVSKIYDLRFENEFKKTKYFSITIAIIYAISLIILGLSLISTPTAIPIYVTLAILIFVPIAIALYHKKQKAQEYKPDDEDEISSVENNQLQNVKIFTNSVIHEINNAYLLPSDGENLLKKFDKELKPQICASKYSLKIETNIKPILKTGIYFFTFAFIGVAVNLIFLQTIFIYISLSILAIIIFSVGYKIHKINFQIKNLNDINYDDDIVDNDINYDDDIVDIEEWIPEQEDPEISEIENIGLSIR